MIAPRLADYIAHLRQAAHDASSFVEGLSKATFMADRRIQQAVIISLMTIGNLLVHGYFEVDLDVVWETTRTAIPKLRQSLRGIDPNSEQ